MSPSLPPCPVLSFPCAASSVAPSRAMEATAEQVRQLRLEAEAAVEAVRGAAAAEAAAWEAEAVANLARAAKRTAPHPPPTPPPKRRPHGLARAA